MSELKITPASQIKPQRQRWLAKMDGRGIIPLQTGTAVAGRGGVGKSTFIIDVIARQTRGELEGDLQGQKHPAIIFGPEDDWATMTVPRLVAAGADLDLVYQVAAEDTINEVTLRRELRFPIDTEGLRQAVIGTGAKLVMIDPAPAVMDGDMNKVQDVRRAYGPLLALAQQHDLAIVLVSHTRKGAGRAADKMSGSTAWRDMVRSYLVFAQEEGSEEVVVTQDKSNYGAAGSSWKFTLEDTLVPLDDGEATQVARIRHLGDSDISVDDIYQREAGESSEEDEDDRHEMDRWLVEVLTEAGGSMAVKDIRDAARASGFEFKTLQNRRPKITGPKVRTGRRGFGKGSVPYWELDDSQIPTSRPDPHTSSHIPGPESPGPTGIYESGSGSMGDEADDPEGATKVPKVSGTQKATPSTPSVEQLTPSPPCSLHGTDHDPESCWTCADLTGTPWSTPTTTERKAAS